MRSKTRHRTRLDLAVWMMSAIASTTFQQSALGDTLYWDVDGATLGGSSLTTASGNWSTSDANWSTSANGNVATLGWNSSAADSAVFSAGSDVTGTSTITVVGTQTVSGISLEEGTVTITGADVNFNSGSTIDVASSTLTIASALIGSGFDKTGSGVLRLEGDNTYTGNTTISEGILQLGAAERIPDGSALTIASGATFDFDIGENDEAIGSLSGDGSVQLVSGTLYVGGDNSSTTFSGAISGTVDGWLYKAGSGTLTLSGINSHPGPVGVGEGVLSGDTIGNMGVPSAFGTGISDQPLFIEYGGTIEYTGPNASTNRPLLLQADGGAISVSNAATTLVLEGVIDGEEFEGDLTKWGAGTLQLDANNTYLGATTIAQGTLRLGNSERIPDGSAVTITGSGALNLNNFNETVGSVAGTNNVALGSGTLTTGGNDQSTTLSGSITGTGSVTKVGSGTFTLTGSSSYSGGNTISGGTLSGNTIANSGTNSSFGRGSFLISNGATLEYTGGSTSTNRTIALGSGGGAVAINSGTQLTISGVISGSSGLTKQGSGILRLTGTNTYSGLTTIFGGTLSGNTIADQGVNSAFGRGDFAIDGGILYYNTFVPASTNRTITLGSGGGSILSGSTLSLTGLIEGSGGLIIDTADEIVVTNPGNSYEGPIDILNGYVRGNSIADAGVNSAFGRGNFIIRNFTHIAGIYYDGPSASTNRTINLAFGAEDYGTIGVLQQSTELALSGVISGTGSLHFEGYGALRLDASNTYAGDTAISLGTLRLGNHQRIPDSSVVYVDSFGGDATLDLNNFNETIGSLEGDGAVLLGSEILTLGSKDGTFSGVISGSGSLIKAGTGTQTLSGANTYTGGTTINGGKLIVSGSIPGSVTVNSGGAFGGSTTVSGNVTGGGRVAPGNSPGILIIEGDYTQTSSSVLEIEIGGRDSDGTPGEDFDHLQVTGTATINGLLEVPIINGFVPAVNDEVTFLTAGSVVGTFNALVSPNLASVNPNVAMEIIKSPSMNPTDVLLRFVAPSIDIQFDNTEAEPATWSEAVNWTTDTVPGTVNIINLQNAPATSQQVNVEAANALVHQLNVTGNDGMMIVGVKNGNFLSATVGTTVGDQAVIELDNGNLASPSVAIEDGGLLAGNGMVTANTLLISGGTISPGFSIGHLDIDGDLELTAGGDLVIEATSETIRDTLAVTGEAILEGSLTLDITGSTIQGGDSIQILTAQNIVEDLSAFEVIGNEDMFFVLRTEEIEPDMIALFTDGFFEGDMNRTGGLPDEDDVAAFALALTDPNNYRGTYGISSPEGGDLDDDGDCDVDDIDDFAELLGMSLNELVERIQAHSNSVPEPSSLLLLMIAAVFGINHRNWA